MPKKQSKSRKVAQRQWRLWVGAGAVALLGLGFLLYQQNVSSTLLLSQAGPQCTGQPTFTKIKSKPASGIVDTTGTLKKITDDTKARLVLAAKNQAFLAVKECPPLDSVGKSVLDKLKCQGSSCGPGQPEGPTLLPYDDKLCSIDYSKFIPAGQKLSSGKTGPGWEVKATCHRWCEWRLACTATSAPQNIISCSKEFNSAYADDWVQVTATVIGKSLPVPASLNWIAPGAYETQKVDKLTFKARYNKAGEYKISPFASGFTTVKECKVTVSLKAVPPPPGSQPPTGGLSCNATPALGGKVNENILFYATYKGTTLPGKADWAVTAGSGVNESERLRTSQTFHQIFSMPGRKEVKVTFEGQTAMCGVIIN
jgi:hypothetical protein